ncbi:DAK2 domain-containing protein [Ligilactobacillus saerimneri]|uniref:DAK2 domain-containing protein n=1 Tax=Ligilactobacillus saerimneri TaxID=228229 RepID=A0A7H9EK99_9LACO|nr:DAK2 domain-containing protein [Ligilactobacillus saerimneri]QLL77819.1 DAK2 domain-containing protein [Ligilactobacillus saerimneri]
MKVTTITGAEFQKMVRVSSQRLNDNADFINRLNVFPVPDGDTGTNMSLSFASGYKYLSDVNSESTGELASALAKGLLMGARGNSGVILSQIFRGFHKSVGDKQQLSAQDLTDAISSGVKMAYKAVMKPQEGTILTVARKAAEAVRKEVKKTDDCVAIMKVAYEAAEEALKMTPELLPVLKEVGVVDSGGQGLVFVYQGFYDALSGNVRPEDEQKHTPSLGEMPEMVGAEHAQSKLNVEDIKNGYCTQIMVRIGRGKQVTQKFDYDTFYNYLADLGDSLLVINDDEVVKVHVHTEYPGKVLSWGQQFGDLQTVKVDNMRWQQEEIIINDKKEEAEAAQPVTNDIAGDYGIVAVASGAGITDILKSLGATYILSGGQTMNPSTKDIVDAINSTQAEKVIVLPNNKNILLAADQAATVVDAEVAVVPTASISEAMTALLAFEKTKTLAENRQDMTDSLQDVTFGKVTNAVRDTTIEGQEIKNGQFMGIIGKKIEIVAENVQQATVKMIEKMVDEDSEIVTILFGANGSQQEAEAIKDAVLAIDEDLEVEIYEGDQPVYQYMVSVE